MITQIGLGIIILAWIYQLISLRSGNKNIRSGFVFSYALGVLILAWDGFVAGLTAIASLNIGSFVVAVLVGVYAVKKK